MLPNELGRCVVSGDRMCAELLAHCPETEVIAERVHFLKCEETGELCYRMDWANAVLAKNGCVNRCLLEVA